MLLTDVIKVDGLICLRYTHADRAISDAAFENCCFIRRDRFHLCSSYHDENYDDTTLRPAGDAIALNTARPNRHLNASIGYEIRKGVTVSLDGTNLTNAKCRSYYGLPQFTRDQRFGDSTYSLGVTPQF